MQQPVAAVTLAEEAREIQFFLSNSEIAMRTAAGEENKLCWAAATSFFQTILLENTLTLHAHLAGCSRQYKDNLRTNMIFILYLHNKNNSTKP